VSRSTLSIGKEARRRLPESLQIRSSGFEKFLPRRRYVDIRRLAGQPSATARESQGAHFIRTHDIAAISDALTVFSALTEAH
jgi:dihydropteroate synthase